MTGRRWSVAHGQPGELVTALVGNPLENPAALGKLRPVVLVRRDGCRWHVMGLTTNSRYRTGAERQAIPNPRAVGLDRPGYLWADHLTAISVLDVRRHLGWVDPPLAQLVAMTADLAPVDAAALMHASGEDAAA